MPYGNPTEGAYFGPAAIGGPPGAYGRRNSKSKPADIVRRIQERMSQSLDLDDRDLVDEESKPCTTSRSVNSIYLEDTSGDNMTRTCSDPELILSVHNQIHLPGGVSPLLHPRPKRANTELALLDRTSTQDVKLKHSPQPPSNCKKVNIKPGVSRGGNVVKGCYDNMSADVPQDHVSSCSSSKRGQLCSRETQQTLVLECCNPDGKSHLSITLVESSH